MNTLNDLTAIFVSVLSGAFSGMFYDVFRIIRKCKKSNDFFVFLEDIIYWVVDALVVFYGLFVSASGAIRWYNAPLILIGFLIYHFTLSRYFVNSGFFALGISLKFFRKIIHAVKFIKKIQK